MSNELAVSHIEASDLLVLVQKSRDSVVVIDVRDEDFEGGHIEGALNIPVEEWEDDDMIDGLVRAHAAANKAMIVFHCMYSQMRGPYCAQRYSAARSRSDCGTHNGLPEIKILRGGFTAWKHLRASLGDDGNDMIVL